ncbi:MAG: hypothetical protein IKC94_05820 [Lentisphaeria bacterium]|nr:hypothetical protein [Lentisphaeria bacterium]
MLKIKFLCTAILLLTVISTLAEPVKTGSRITSLPSPLYLDDSNRTLGEFLGEKYVVLFIWEMDNAALGEFYAAANLANRHKDIASFIGVGIGRHQQLKRFPGAMRLGFPVNSDHRGAAKALFLRSGDPMPLTVLLDKNGTLLWRGKLQNLPPVLNKCRQGKFDLAEELRIEKFSGELNAAIQAGKIDEAVALLRTEYQKYPEKLELLRQLFSLLCRQEKFDDAFAMLRCAQQRTPENYRLYELEYRSIGELEETGRLPEFFSRLKTAFARRPDILIAFALAECQLPPEKLNLPCALDLAYTGWQNQNFPTAESRGLYALDYASILHSIGRNDLAATLAAQACEDLKNNASQLTRARDALIYYTKMLEIAPHVSLPDLKK